MFNLFKKQISQQDFEEEDSPQALILRSVFESSDEFGSEEEVQAIYELEDKLEEAFMGTGYDVDGHEIGDTEFVIYIYGEDADEAFNLAKVVLRTSPFVWFNVTLRLWRCRRQKCCREAYKNKLKKHGGKHT